MSNDFRTYFNPDDSSQWANQPPETFIRNMVAELLMKVDSIEWTLKTTTENPDVESVTKGIMLGQFTLDYLLQNSLEHCEDIKLALQTAMAYTKTLGDINPKQK